MRTPRKLVSALAAATAAVALLAGCPMQVVIFQVNFENPNPRVGESTVIRLEAQVGLFRTPYFYYRAQRGRVVGLNGETAPQGGYVRAGNQVRYFAPYTSNYPSADGIRQNDTIEIIAQDGPFTSRLTRQVVITGSTVVFAQPDAQQSGQNGTLMIAIDSGGGQMQTQPQPLLDLNNQPIKGSSPVIAPNGERIAFVVYPGDGTSRIAMRDAAGQVINLTSFPRGLSLDPAWSPDGTYLLFASNHETSDGTFDLYMMNVDQTQGGRAVTRLTNNTWDDRHPAWNPVPTAAEDRLIAVSSRKNTLQSPGGRAQNWNIFLMDRRGNYTREISVLQGDGDNWGIEPSWHPNGQALAYTRFGPVVNFQSSSNKFQRIYIQDLQQSASVVPLNLSNMDPQSRESSPIWSTERPNTLYFLRTDANAQYGARVFQTQYIPGNQGNSSFQPMPVAAFQGLNLPITQVGGTNRDISGYHPFDWR